MKQKLLCVLSEVIRFYDMHTENRTLWVKSAEFFMTLTSFALLFFFFIEYSRGGILKSAKDYVFLQLLIVQIVKEYYSLEFQDKLITQ